MVDRSRPYRSAKRQPLLEWYGQMEKVGVVKSMIAALTDGSNVARGCSLMPMARAVDWIIGCVGSFSRCHHLVPDVLGRPVLQLIYRRSCITIAKLLAKPLLTAFVGRIAQFQAELR